MKEDAVVLLAQHPHPHMTESQRGYLLRLSEANGYRTPYAIFSLAALENRSEKLVGTHLGRVAAVCNVPIETLSPLRHIDGDRRTYRLLEHAVPADSLRRKHLPICPLCVQAKGMIEGHWDLMFMTGCPEHRRAVLMQCPECRKPLQVFRQGLLRCVCGASLLTNTSRDLPPQEVDLLDVIRRKVLRLPQLLDYESGIPARELANIDLRGALGLIRALGGYWSREIGKSKFQDESTNTVSAAARALSFWPGNFYRILDVIAQKDEAMSGNFTRSSLRSIHAALIKSWAKTNAERRNFVKEAFAGYSVTRWRFSPTKIFSTETTFRSKDDRYLSPAKLGERLRVDHRTAKGMLQNGIVPTIEIQIGKEKRLFADTVALQVSPVVKGRIYRERTAAGIIGIPVTLLKRLKTHGDFQCQHIPHTKPGYHEADIEIFIKTLMAKAAVPGTDWATNRTFLTFRQALKRIKLSSDLQAKFVRAILDGQFKVFRGKTPAKINLMLSEKDLHALAEAYLEETVGPTETFKRAAEILGCDQPVIRLLIKRGLLKTVQIPGYTRISRNSVLAFQRKYVSLAIVAKQEKTNSQALMNCCKRTAIEMLILRIHAQCHHAMIYRSDLQRLISCFRQRHKVSS